jgi:hypothetical protein
MQQVKAEIPKFLIDPSRPENIEDIENLRVYEMKATEGVAKAITELRAS